VLFSWPGGKEFVTPWSCGSRGTSLTLGHFDNQPRPKDSKKIHSNVISVGNIE